MLLLCKQEGPPHRTSSRRIAVAAGVMDTSTRLFYLPIAGKNKNPFRCLAAAINLSISIYHTYLIVLVLVDQAQALDADGVHIVWALRPDFSFPPSIDRMYQNVHMAEGANKRARGGEGGNYGMV